MGNELIGLNTSGDEWKFRGKIDSWEELFMRKENFLPIIEPVKKLARGLVADPLTKEGEISIKSLAKKIGKLNRDIEEKGKGVAAELKAKPKLIDATRKAVRDALDEYKAEVLKPITDIEERRQTIVDMTNIPAQGIGCDEAALQTLLDQLFNLYASRTDWAESAQDALQAKNDGERQINSLIAAEKKRKDDAEKFEKFQAKETEYIAQQNRIAEEAKKRAEKEKEAAELAKEEAERKAKEADLRAQDAMRALEKKMAEEAEKNKNNPEPDRETKRTVNREALDSLMSSVMLPEDTAKAVITAIATGKIKHVRIDYTI
jgi:flagellar biosynthesis GTPase FlhF